MLQSKSNPLSVHRLLSLYVAFLFVLYCSGCQKSTQTADAHTEIEIPQNYNIALRVAEEKSSSDQLKSSFAVTQKITLTGSKILMLSKLRVIAGKLYVIDSDRRVVESYDSNGKFIKQLGEGGNKPGGFLFPTDATETKEGFVAVTDFQGHRVNIFDGAGDYKNSFVYTPQVFSAQKLLFDQSSQRFYLFGNRWQHDADEKLQGAELVHAYSSDGVFQVSMFPFPDKAKPLDLYAYDEPMIDAKDGNVYYVLPFEYKIWKLLPDNNPQLLMESNSEHFRFPTEKLDLTKAPRTKTVDYVQSWKASWTPMTGMAAVGDKLIVQYQTFNPLRYTVDIWSIPQKKILKTLSTNHLLLTRDSADSIYFLSNIEIKGQHSYELLCANLVK